MIEVPVVKVRFIALCLAALGGKAGADVTTTALPLAAASAAPRSDAGVALLMRLMIGDARGPCRRAGLSVFNAQRNAPSTDGRLRRVTVKVRADGTALLIMSGMGGTSGLSASDGSP